MYPNFFNETVNDTQSLTITDDSNILQIPVHNITQNPIIDQNQNDTTHITNQNNTSTLSTSNTHITHNFLLKLPYKTLLNKVLLIHMSQMHLIFNVQYNSKQLLQQDSHFYKP